MLKSQENMYDHPDSKYFFLPSPSKPFVVTTADLGMYGDTVHTCLDFLQRFARTHNGLDYLQVFTHPKKEEALWFIEDDEGGAITALLPPEY